MKLFIGKIKAWQPVFSTDVTSRLAFGLTVGQPLVLRREPTNPVDVNAVIAHDILLQPVGYLDHVTAAKVAPLMDAGLVPDAKVLKIAKRIGDRIRWPRAIIRFEEKTEEDKDQRYIINRQREDA